MKNNNHEILIIQENLLTAYYAKFKQNVPNERKDDLVWISGQLKDSINKFHFYNDDKKTDGEIIDGILYIGAPSSIPLVELYDILREADAGDYAKSVGNLITYSLMLHQRVKDEPAKVQWPDISDDLFSLKILMDKLLNFKDHS